MEASSFKFTPNNIKANQGDEITINITNISDAGHDFTIKDPQGQIIKHVDLPSSGWRKLRSNFRKLENMTFIAISLFIHRSA